MTRETRASCRWSGWASYEGSTYRACRANPPTERGWPEVNIDVDWCRLHEGELALDAIKGPEK